MAFVQQTLWHSATLRVHAAASAGGNFGDLRFVPKFFAITLKITLADCPGSAGSACLPPTKKSSRTCQLAGAPSAGAVLAIPPVNLSSGPR